LFDGADVRRGASLKKMAVGLKAKRDFLALLRPVSKPVLLFRKPEFHFKLLTASQV